MYHALKGKHLTFSTHYQPYSHDTPNALDLLPKWPHGDKIQKSRKVDFSTFSSDPSKFRFIEKFLVASTIRTLHDHNDVRSFLLTEIWEPDQSVLIQELG